MGSIITNKWSIHQLVTVLHESLQSKSHIWMLEGQCRATDRTHPVQETNIEQHIHNPRHMHCHPPKLNKSATTSFEEARQLNLCFKSGDEWEKYHRCRHGNIPAHAPHPLTRGTSAVHLVQEMISGLEVENVPSDNDDTNYDSETKDLYHLEAWIGRGESTSSIVA